MFHEDSYDNIDQDKLGHQDKDDKEDRSNDGTDTAISLTVVGCITVLPQCVLKSITQLINQSINHTLQRKSMIAFPLFNL